LNKIPHFYKKANIGATGVTEKHRGDFVIQRNTQRTASCLEYRTFNHKVTDDTAYHGDLFCNTEG